VPARLTTDGFCQHYYGAVLAFVRRAVSEPDEAVDLTQEVFLRVVRGLRTYTDRDREAAWVFAIARRVLSTHATRADLTVSLDRLGDTGEDAAPAVQDFQSSLREAVARLPPDARDVFTLRDAHGLSYREIAEALGLTVDGVRGRLARVRRRLGRTVVWTTSRSSGYR
jgi:RNA polymerase sigma-70 factor (ECF subfamily)